MVTKVGSAGPAMDSVISFGGANKAAAEGASSQKKNTVNTDQKTPRKSVTMASDRIPKASELASELNTIRARTTSNKAENESVIQQPKTVQDKEPQHTINITTAEAEAMEKPNMELSREAIEDTVKHVNENLKPANASVEFSFHEKTKRYSFKVLDNETGEVIREVPPEKSLDMVAKMFEMVGILVDETL